MIVAEGRAARPTTFAVGGDDGERADACPFCPGEESRTPPEVASWGNIMAEGRTYFLVAPWIILAPGVVLALTVLAINLLGDGVRDMLDPRFAKRF